MKLIKKFKFIKNLKEEIYKKFSIFFAGDKYENFTVQF